MVITNQGQQQTSFQPVGTRHPMLNTYPNLSHIFSVFWWCMITTSLEDFFSGLAEMLKKYIGSTKSNEIWLSTT